MRRAPRLRAEAIVAGLADPFAEPDETTDALLGATARLLATYGLRRWSMEEVAEQAGLGRATLYRRFASRDELVHAALGREVREFFGAIAAAVTELGTVEDQLVEGFLTGWRLMQESVMGELFTNDRAAAVSLLTSSTVLALARAALVERYQIVTGAALSDREAADAELVAEALVRLGLSFVLIPDSVIDRDDTQAARASLRRLLGPLSSPVAIQSRSGR
jgi:AcrR family transcriptional regulator